MLFKIFYKLFNRWDGLFPSVCGGCAAHNTFCMDKVFKCSKEGRRF